MCSLCVFIEVEVDSEISVLKLMYCWCVLLILKLVCCWCAFIDFEIEVDFEIYGLEEHNNTNGGDIYVLNHCISVIIFVCYLQVIVDIS